MSRSQYKCTMDELGSMSWKLYLGLGAASQKSPRVSSNLDEHDAMIISNISGIKLSCEGQRF